MKRKMVIAVLGLFCAVLAYGGTITVTQPSGGSLTMGCPVQITWTASGVSSNVKIQLIRPGGGLVGPLATDLPVGSSPFSWTVAAPAVVGEQYRIRVHAKDGTADGESAIFTVTAPGPAASLSLQSPHGGESWEIESTQPITWTAFNIAANCRLVLLKNDQVQGTIRDSFAPGQGAGSWNWHVGDYQGGPAPAESGYKVRIETVSGDVIYSAQSANSFTLTAPPIIFQPIAPVVATIFAASSPDLVACLAWDNQRPYLQEHKRITVRIKNVGQAAAPETTFSLYVEQHGHHTVTVRALPPHTSVSWSKLYKWATLGHKTVRVTVDPDNQVTEANENNNEISKSINVISPFQDRYVEPTDICSDQN
jgi:hypothetical protein